MFNLGFGEILVICVVLIIVVGPERLPSVMKNVGKAMRTVREVSREIQSTVGLDELWREDVLAPPPPRVPPAATVSRSAEPVAPVSSPEAAAAAGTPAPPAAPASSSIAEVPPAAPIASEPATGDAHVNGSGGIKGEG